MGLSLLSGNEAIARGAFEAGVRVATGYPGTPSTEILETIEQYPSIYSQWSPNEKVALEVGIGASLAGSRVIVTMKHVGLNVAADPLLTITESGVNGGLVVISADDPGMHSSQNEQDNRFYGKFAKIPVLEPSDSQEAKDMVGHALAISEEFDTPVILRITTRIAHSKTLVDLQEPQDVPIRPYEKNVQKNVMIPAHARVRHTFVEERLAKLEKFAGSSELNRIERQDRKVGVITNGISYQYVKEVMPNASILKLGITYPLSAPLIEAFSQEVEELWVVEEGEPFIEDFVRLLGIPVRGKQYTGKVGELSPDRLREGITHLTKSENRLPVQQAPSRPPVMCPGCPHRGAFHVLAKRKFTVTGDIGCYTLGMLPPLNAMDTCVCMGASIPMALGMEKGGLDPKKVVAVIGDSTFFHSGITGLVDVIYNQGHTRVLILDNHITAMTGHQDHPGTGRDIHRQPAPQVDLVKLVEALGVEVKVVDPLDIGTLDKYLKEETDQPRVIVCKRPCALIAPATEAYQVDRDLCRSCKACIRTGCPALRFDEKSYVDPNLCTGCGLCATVCPFDAIKKVGEASA